MPTKTIPDDADRIAAVQDLIRQRRDERVAAIGELIRRRRTELGWGQTELAARLGVTQPQVSRWERGQHGPRARQLIALARLLDLEPEDLVVVA